MPGSPGLVLLVLILAAEVCPVHAARRSQGEGGNYLWWERLVDLPYRINLFSGSWPAVDETLNSPEEFEAAIDGAFQIWENTGFVSFEKGTSVTTKDPNDTGCGSLSTMALCDADDECLWISDIGCLLYVEAPQGVNIISNANTGWEGDAGVIAHTVVWYYPGSGEIIDADILINDVNWDFDLGSHTGRYNLKGILAHEIGHILGVAHPCTLAGSGEDWTLCSQTGGQFQEVTMYPAAEPTDDTKLITLESDDIAALQMVCADTKTLCYQENLLGEVKVEQGVGCFRVEEVS